ncbi:MAG: diguanylate cyclase [Candidatus Omnitrophota bacterium]|nr:diguanylate cyclase [Candidatus Omnitrophota bacterium]
MMGLFKKMSLAPKGLRYKLIMAFSLMSIIPILACAYIIFSYSFPTATELISIAAVIAISIVIAMLGLILARGLVDPVIDMAIEAKMIANGEFGREISVSSPDEIGILGESINSMTQKIRLNLDELKSFGQRTKELNIEIHKKVLALSSLLQIGDLVASGSTELDAILELSAQKVSMLFDGGFCVFYMMPKEESSEFLPKAHSSVREEALLDIIVRKGEGLLGKIVQNRTFLIVDKSTKMNNDIEEFRQSHNVKNMVVVPIYSGNKDYGLFIVGNRLDDYRYKTDDIDLIKIFSKQVTIAIENDIWIKKTEEFSIKDDLTDLYNKNYVLSRLDEEIRRSIFYQRPCSFLVFNIDNFKTLRDVKGELVAEDIIKKVAKVIKDNTTPVGKAARIGGDEFAMLLPEKNKRQAAEIAEDLRKKIEATNFSRDGKFTITVSGGVSENPIDGSTQEELFKKAMEALQNAKSLGKNRVVA